MSQFGAAGKNPPWMRAADLPLAGSAMLAQAGATLASALSQPQTAVQQQQSQTFNTNLAALGLTQNALQATTVLSQAGLGLATTPANLTYPTQARILGAPPTGVPAPGPAPSAKQRVFTGTVTKLHDNFGFVDEDVFFQTSAIKGTMPKVGERVLVEASYNQNMPFKWNAYRIQLLANQMNAQVGVRLGTQTSAAGNQANTSATMAAQTQYINSITSENSLSKGGRSENEKHSYTENRHRGDYAYGNNSTRTQTRRPSSPTPMRRAVSPAQLRRDRDMRHDDRRDRYQDRNSNRDFDRDRRPYNRMEDRTRDRFLNRNTEDRNLDRNVDRMPDRMHDRNFDRMQDRSLDRMQDRGMNRMQDRMPDRMQDRSRLPMRDRRSPIMRERDRDRDVDHDRDRDRDLRGGALTPERDFRGGLDHEGSGLPRKHALSPSRRGSSPPPRRKPRLMPRYVVDIPAISLDQCEMGVVDLKKRYPNLYIPSDFFHANICWQRAFPLHRPFSLNHPCGFQVLPKDTLPPPPLEPLTALGDGSEAPPAPPPPPAVLNPPDLDFSFSAKVMLLSAPALEELYQQSCALAEESEEGRLGSMHPARILSFLVGLKGKSETVALGGPWSPSLDGPNPSSDPRVLIRTAVRTCRALTGIDLSACTQWYRFAEICYRRESSSSSCATLERVVLFFPDVWRCMPTRQEWADLELRLRSISLCGAEDPAGDAPAQEEESAVAVAEETNVKEPTHHSELDPKTMKVGDLRTELEARGLLTKGLKSQLVARLAKALKAEAEQEEEEEEEEVEEEAEEMEEGGEVVDEANEEEEEVEAVEEEAPESEPEEEKPVNKKAGKKKAAATEKAPNKKAAINKKADDSKGATDGKGATVGKGATDDEKAPVKKTPDKKCANKKAADKKDADDGKVADDEKAADDGKAADNGKAAEEDAAKDEEEKKEEDEKPAKEEPEDGPKKSPPDPPAAPPTPPAPTGKALSLDDLPERPTILVYPSRKAKGGRFDCSVMSLSVLLDYRQEDNKEHSFEVSLFAELFNEMLIRDCAFNIYRALLEAPEAKEEKKKEKEPAKDADKKGDRRDDRKADRRDRRERKDEEKKADADQEDSDGASEASNADAESEETKERRQKKEAKQQNKTVNKHLLLSFIYFDQNQCGYVLERDLEDIFYIIGLKLSRGQVRRLLQKVSKREVVRYRSLTDAPVCPEEMAEEQEEEEADEEMEEEAQGVEEKSELDLEELALGNKSLLLNLEVVNTEETDKAGGATGAAPMEVTSGGPATSNMVFHEGAILDVAKLLRQVERSERARTSSETRLKEVMEALAEVRESWDVSRQGAQRTQLELDQARRQLTAAEEELAGARKTAQELRLTLQNCRQHLQATLGSLDTVLGRKVEVVKKEPLDN